jgi:hypothetical protein
MTVTDCCARLQPLPLDGLSTVPPPTGKPGAIETVAGTPIAT